ncbi:MAG: DUF4139 domain-containing protein [Steroidobacteraceae bacterium]
MPRKTLSRLLLAAGLVLAAGAQAADSGDTSITIYSSAQPGGVPAEFYRPMPGGAVPNGMAVPGYAMVRDTRTMQLAAGRSIVRFTDVAALIDPTTVSFQSLTDPATRVLEQNYQFDLIGMDKLLARYIDRPVTVDRPARDGGPATSGTLLSAGDGLVVRGADGSIHALREYGAVHFSELPGGLITRPTLVWDIDAARGGAHRTRVTYQTGGITWWADYNLIFKEGKDANSGTIDLGAWVSIVNQSGASYGNARLKLIAGDVQRVAPPQRAYVQKRAMEMAVTDQAVGFAEKPFFEFHLYTLGRRTTLPDNSTKQIELFDEARAIPAKKVLVYYGAPDFGAFGGPYLDRDYGTATNRKVDVYLEFRNDEAKGLGIPLPAGRVRVAKPDSADDSLEFIGEDVIDHTPRDEEVRIRLGSAFDVVGERRQVDFRIDTKARTMEEEIEVEVRNHKSEPVEVLVRETLFRWSGWTMVSKSHDYVKEDARTIHFPVRVAKDGETIVRYRVRYHW